MIEAEAIRYHDQLRDGLANDFSNRVAEGWPATRPTPRLWPDGSWLFVYATDQDPQPVLRGKPVQAIVVRPDRSVYLLVGACARTANAFDLGLPLSQERFLGSTPFGRYQSCDRGIAVWEGPQDIGYAVQFDGDTLAPLRSALGLVAFSDLRGFTEWSKQASPAQIQATLSDVESSLQRAFRRTWCSTVFLKGTGDGMMMLSELSWYSAGGPSDDPPVPGHALEFTRALCRFARDAQTRLARAMAIGIGADFGTCHQVFILGRYDYVGAPINNAAKLQQLAWNEIIVSPALMNLLERDGSNVATRSKQLPGRGYRFDTEVFLRDDEADIWRTSEAGGAA